MRSILLHGEKTDTTITDRYLLEIVQGRWVKIKVETITYDRGQKKVSVTIEDPDAGWKDHPLLPIIEDLVLRFQIDGTKTEEQWFDPQGNPLAPAGQRQKTLEPVAA